MQRANSILIALALCCVLLAGLAGCGGVDSNEALARVNSSNIQRLANLYFTFQSTHEWRGPTDKAEFKEFVRGFDPQKLARVGVDANGIDALFTSERDGQPFKIRYSVKGSAMGSSEPVIFESTGIDGKRQVGFLDMTQREVDAAEYETLWTSGAPATNARPQ